jgi:hypothetical protein
MAMELKNLIKAKDGILHGSNNVLEIFILTGKVQKESTLV